MLDSRIPQETTAAPTTTGGFDDIEVVVADAETFAPFVEDAIAEYRLGLESVTAVDSPLHRPNSFGLLGGVLEDDALVVKQIAFATNVRAVEAVPLEEFRENIVPQFGKQYDDGERGFWCDSRELLKIVREFENAGLEMLGSVHMHPDWHRIGPAHERGTDSLSERPSRMDEYLFRNAGWPLNIICYLESRGDGITHTYAAWRPPGSEDPSARAREMTIRFFAQGHNGAA
ncbi:hypothetical protein LHJ74_04240 [Streptomyces sp. N2-109]|uniref:JAB domain-containing protein n=1 Tax=Streptomyces gossypii TaxID=2883101 RepID=A0ABT2JMP0_9ACTN|nr:hypothetical protein [Streptomyces gossypii]MCT2589153.1 hypothetical protein [Streptomyces gossypii]